MGEAQQISKAEYERLQDARDDAVNSGLADIAVKDTTGASLAMMGAHYHIGNITLPQFTLRTVVLLSIAEVSMADGESENAASGIQDIAVALYIIANPEACDCLMGVRQRLDGLKRLEHLAAKSPDMFQRYLDKVDEVGGSAFAQIEADAIAFLDELEGVTVVEIEQVISQMAEDFAATQDLLPSSEDTEKK
jgi:hypothetical protein